MRTPTVCCGSTCRMGLTCPCTRKPSSTKWLGSSTNDHTRPWDLQLQPNDLMLVLHRLEPARAKRTCIGRQSGSGGKERPGLCFFVLFLLPVPASRSFLFLFLFPAIRWSLLYGRNRIRGNVIYAYFLRTSSF